jgi:hypothetical protein
MDILCHIREFVPFWTKETLRIVRRSAATLNDLSDADLAVEAHSRNPRWGLTPASFVVDHLLVQHVERHLGQMRRNIAQFGDGRPQV